MFGLFGNKTEREIRQLNKDAPNIIEYTYQSLGTETVRKAALMTAEHLERVHRVFEDDLKGAKRAIAEYQTLHKEAVRRHDDVALTAFTLLLIYVRAELQGAACRPARQAIDDFVAQWAHVAKD